MVQIKLSAEILLKLHSYNDPIVLVQSALIQFGSMAQLQRHINMLAELGFFVSFYTCC